MQKKIPKKDPLYETPVHCWKLYWKKIEFDLKIFVNLTIKVNALIAIQVTNINP